MKKSNFSESQIIKILSQQEAGLSVSDICREALSITVDTSLPAHRVIRELEKLVE